MMVMMVLMMKVMVMMIPMKSRSMVTAMAMTSPSQGGISPADFCLPESSFSLWCFSPRSGSETLLGAYLRS